MRILGGCSYRKEENMKKALIVLLVVMCFFLVACDDDDNAVRRGKTRINDEGGITPTEIIQEDNEGDKPTVAQMLEDVSNIPDFYLTENDVWEVVDAKETLARKIDDKTYQTTIEVKLTNDIYKEAYRNISLLYDYYDIGGWILNSFWDITNIYDAQPQAGMHEEVGIRDIKNIYDGSLVLVSHDTNIKDKTDTFVFTREVYGELFTQISEVKLEYHISDASGLWTVYNTYEADRRCEYEANYEWIIVSKDSNTNSYISPFKHCVTIREFNENTVTLNVIDYAEIHWISTGIYGQGYYTDDFFSHFEGLVTPENFQYFSCSGEYKDLYYACYTLTGLVSYDPEIDGYRIEILNKDFSENQMYIKPEGVYITKYVGGPMKLQNLADYVYREDGLDENMRKELLNAQSYYFE